ncbi:MAG: phage tail tape measure protein [Clostridium celatum]|nr:phage tail tape measure protein [Clostridium celatum]
MIKASQAGTSLRQILLGLQGGVELVTKSTDSWVIETENADGSMRNLNDVVVDLREAFADMTDSQKASNAETIAGKIGMSGLLSIVNASEKDFNKLTGAIDNSTGVAKKMADTMQNNLKGKITQLKSALEGAGIAIGENLIPALTTGVNKITDMVSAFNKLDPATQKTIVSVGATVAAIGPLMMIGGKLITGVGKTISLVSTITSLAGSGLVTALGAVATPLLVVAGGFYAWHEAVDVGNQSIAVAREEMSFMERTMADLTGMTTYSKDELIDMGLVYKDFNENISTDFQDKVKDMTIDIHDFGMSLEEINVDKVITEEEANNLTTRVNGALESCISAIDTKSSELQDGFSKAFSVDSVIDENETALLEYWNSRGTKEKEEAQKLQSEINNIINTARAEGRELRPEEISAIQNYYAQIKQIELECQASNQYEIEYATQEFQNRISTMDAESAQQLLGQRFEQYQEQQLATKTNYDTLIAMAQENYEILSEEDKIRVDDTIARLEAAKAEELRINQEKYDANIDYAIQNNEELANIFNRYTGEKIDRIDLANYQEYEQMRNHYEGIAEVTESGYKRVYDTATGTWKDLYVSVDSTTGQLKGVYDLNTQNVAAMTRDDESALRDEVAAWQNTSEGILMNTILAGNAYQDLEGNIRNSTGEIIGHIESVTDENGNLIQSIVDLNGNKINIQGNWQDAINKANEVNTAIQNIRDKTVTISVNQKGYANEKGSGFTPMYATGTESTMPGIASVGEYGSELIVGSGAMTIASSRQLMSFTGGETVYNARQTKEILSSLEANNNMSNISELINTIKATTKEVIKAISSSDRAQTIHADNMYFNNEGSVERNISNVKRLFAAMK